MESGEPREQRFRLLGPIIALVGFVAATVEILNYFEVKPRDILVLASQVKVRPPGVRPAPFDLRDAAKGPAMAAIRRPARLVLILKNTGDAEDMRKVVRAASRFADLLDPEDSVSLITFAGARHPWVFRDLPGDRARREIEGRLKGLFASAKASLGEAVEEAERHLGRGSSPGKSSAIVVLSASADRDDMLDPWIAQIRTGSDANPRVLMTPGDSADVVQ
jgi:hypothetical protein